MNLRQFRYFVSIVDSGSLSKAAEVLYIAQPSLSQQITAMENDLGVPLLVRNSKGVSATQAGQVFYRHARQMLRQLEQLKSEVSFAGTAEVGEVRLGLPTSVAAILSLSLYNALERAHPGIRLNLIEGMSGNLGDLLANGRIDLAILFRGADWRGAEARPLLKDALCVYGTAQAFHAAGIRTRCSIRKLQDIRLVLPSRSNSLRMLLDNIFTTAGVAPKVIADVDSLPTLMALAAERNVLTILSAGLAHQAAERGLTLVAFGSPAIHRTVSLCWLTGTTPNAAVEATRVTLETTALTLVKSGGWPGASALLN